MATLGSLCFGGPKVNRGAGGKSNGLKTSKSSRLQSSAAEEMTFALYGAQGNSGEGVLAQGF